MRVVLSSAAERDVKRALDFYLNELEQGSLTILSTRFRQRSSA